jgi:hypothetical protein
MADRKGALIHEPPSPTEPHRPDVAKDPPPALCVGCGVWHGGVGAEMNCLRRVVTTLRARLEEHDRAHAQENRRLRAMLEEFEPGRKGNGT